MARSRAKPDKCRIKGCDRKIVAKEMCGMHYQRKRDGRPLHAPAGYRRKKVVHIAGRLNKTERALVEAIKADIRELAITEGERQDELFEILDWQHETIEGFARFRRTAFTMARSNGKTTFVAALGVSAIKPGGALFRKRGQTVIVASSLMQGDVCFQHILYFMAPLIYDSDGKIRRKEWRVADNHHAKSIEHVPTGTRLRVLGSDAKRAHGLAPSLAILDEPAKWVKGGESLFIAIRTGMGKQPNSKLLAIGTMPEDVTHWFARMLTAPDKTTWARVYAATQDDIDENREFEPDTIRKANPSYDHLKSLRDEINAAIVAAKEKGGTDLAAYRALHLNMGTPELADREMLIDLDNWKAVVRRNPAPKEGPVAIGIDLGGGTSMSAMAFYWPITGRLECYGAFPAKPNLLERGKNDGVGEAYAAMEKRGEVTVYPGVETNNVRFLKDHFALVQQFEWIDIAADKYQKTKVEQALLEMGLGHVEVNFRRVGQGPEGKEDIEAFQSEVLEPHLSVGENLIVDMAIANSVVERDGNRNPRVMKSHQKGRIDVIQAAILAVGIGQRHRKPPEGDGLSGWYDRMLSDNEDLVVAV